jgi:hypothetical protein
METSTIIKIILIILLLAYFGINVFQYLANTTTHIAQTTEWLATLIGRKVETGVEETERIIGDTTKTSLTGLKYGLDKTLGGGTVGGGTVGGGMRELDKTLSSSLERNQRETQRERGQQGTEEEEENQGSYQQRIPRSGYCYIGKENGYRTCARVGVNDLCMSEQIFPTIDICINPKLRV